MLSVFILQLVTLSLSLHSAHCHFPNGKEQSGQLSKLFANFERISPYLGILGKPEPESAAATTEKYARILQGRQTSLRALASVPNEEQAMKHLRQVCTEASNTLAKEPVKRVREAKEGLERLFNVNSAVSSKKMREDSEFENDLKTVADLFLNPRLFTEGSNLDLLAKVARRQQQRLGNLKPANAEAFELVRAVLKGQDPHCSKESATCPRCLIENLQIPKYCERLKDLAKTDRRIEQAHAQQSERYSRVVSDLSEILRDYSSSDTEKQVSKDAPLAAKFAQITPIWNLYKSSKYFDKANEPAYEYLSTLSKAEFLHLRDQLQKEISKTSSDKDKSNNVTMQQKKIMSDLVEEIDGVSKRIARSGNRTQDTENAELIEKLHSLKRRLVEKEAAYESSMKMSTLYQDKLTALFKTKDAMNATQLDNLVRKIAQMVLPGGYSTKARGEIPIEAVRKHLEHLRPDSVDLQGNYSARNSRINPYAHNERIREIDSNKKQLLDELDVLMRVSYKIFDILRNEGDLASHNATAYHKLMQDKADEITAKKHALRVAFVEAALDERLLKEHGLYQVQSEHSHTVRESKPKTTLKKKDSRPNNEDGDDFDYDNDDDDDDFDDDDDEDSQWEKSELIKEKGGNGKKSELNSRPSETNTGSGSRPSDLASEPSANPKDKTGHEVAKTESSEPSSRPSVSDGKSQSRPTADSIKKEPEASSVDKAQAQHSTSAPGTKEPENIKDILSQLISQYSNQDADQKKDPSSEKSGDSEKEKKTDLDTGKEIVKTNLNSDSEADKDGVKKADSDSDKSTAKRPHSDSDSDSDKSTAKKPHSDTDSDTANNFNSMAPSTKKQESSNPSDLDSKSKGKDHNSSDSEDESITPNKKASPTLKKSHSLDSDSKKPHHLHRQSSESTLEHNVPSKTRKDSQSSRPKKCKEPEPETSQLANDESFLPDSKNCDCSPITQMRIPNH